MKVIETQTIADAHKKLVCYVAWEGVRMVTEDGQDCTEAEPVTVTIHNPMSSDMIHPASPAQELKCIEYIKQIFNGAKGFEYTYHERLFEHYRDIESPIDQIRTIINHLNAELNTRRAVAITWYPWKDPDTQHVPCLQFVQFKVRKQKFGFLCWLLGKQPKLDMYILFRSEDVLGAFGQNAVGLAALQSFVARHTGCVIGKYEHIITIPHFYQKTNAPELKRMTADAR